MNPEPSAAPEDPRTVKLPASAEGRPVQAAASGIANPDATVPYEFRQEIARGGMGSIIEARDCKIGRTVAVKVMLAEMGTDEDRKQRFINEAAVLGTLEHPNIVPIHDLGRDADGQLFYTMKLVHGRNLQAILNGVRDGTAEIAGHYTLDRLLLVFRKVCDALAFAHSRGVIHRDLKPENIMVGEFGEVLVMDWGLAKQTGSAADGTRKEEATRRRAVASEDAEETAVADAGTRRGGRDALRRFLAKKAGKDSGVTLEGEIMGTPQYMSPEQAQGRIAEMDARSDIFSLGGILYAILTLRPPVEGSTLEEVLRKVSSGGITSPSAFGTGTGKGTPGVKGAVFEAKKIRPLPHCPGGRVPGALSSVVMKALSVKREDRYQTVAAFSADVEAFQNGFATGAENAGAWKLFTLFVKRNKAASIGVAAVLVVGSVLGAKAIIEGRRAERMLGELRGTAPTFAEQARALITDGSFEDALKKAEYAVKLAPEEAEHHVLRGDILQSLLRLADAGDAYRDALKRDPAHRFAAENAELSRRLAPQLSGGELPRAGYEELFRAMKAQGRTDEATIIAGNFGGQTKELLNKWKPILADTLKEYRFGLKADEGATLNLDLQGNKEAYALTDISFLKGMPVRTLDLSYCGQLTDITPLAGAPLADLNLSGAGVLDLTPLKGTALRRLKWSSGRKARDLTPLAGVPLEWLDVHTTAVSDLAPLKGAPLRFLDIASTDVSDLSALSGSPLEELNAAFTETADLAPLAGLPLVSLNLSGTRVTNLAPLRGLPLKHLSLESTPVSDLAPLASLPLETLMLVACNNIRDLSPLAEIKTLESLTLPSRFRGQVDFLRTLPRLRFISWTGAGKGKLEFRPVRRTAAEFWKQEDANKKILGPALPAMIQAGIHPDVLTGWDGGEWALGSNKSKGTVFSDITAFAGIPLSRANISGVKITDLSPLKGMPIHSLVLTATSVTDLKPLAGMPLRTLNISVTPVSDISPLTGMKLEEFIANASTSKLTDISALRGMPLREAHIQGTNVADISPLADCLTLEYVVLPIAQKGKLNLEPLRRLPKLEKLAWGRAPVARPSAQPAAEFWKEYDAWKAAGGK